LKGADSQASSVTGQSYLTPGFAPVGRRNIKLPKIELERFNGELKELLSLWSQWDNIHDDETLRA
jgi:hypothetical protein